MKFLTFLDRRDKKTVRFEENRIEQMERQSSYDVNSICNRKRNKLRIDQWVERG